MDTDFGRDIITITDEDGVEYELEILSTVEYEGALYYALAPIDTDDDEELEVSILKAVEEDGEEVLETIDETLWPEEIRLLYSLTGS